jgi:hypothetical protein
VLPENQCEYKLGLLAKILKRSVIYLLESFETS